MLPVEVVGRLIKKEDVRLFKQELSQKHLGTLTARKLGNIIIKSYIAKTKGSSHFLYF